jgi:hypothetical protein
MALKDLFGPRWKHPDWRVRQKYYGKKIKSLLADIDKSHADEEIRKAFCQLPDDGILRYHVLQSYAVVSLDAALPLLASWLKSRPPADEKIVNPPLRQASSEWGMPLMRVSSQDVLDILSRCFETDRSKRGEEAVQLRTQADADWLRLRKTATSFLLNEYHGKFYPMTIGEYFVLAPSMICLTLYGDHVIGKTGNDSFSMLVHTGGVMLSSKAI